MVSIRWLRVVFLAGLVVFVGVSGGERGTSLGIFEATAHAEAIVVHYTAQEFGCAGPLDFVTDEPLIDGTGFINVTDLDNTFAKTA